MSAPAETLDAAPSVRVRALSLGDRIDTTGLERSDTISTVPLAFHVGRGGFAALYRMGVAVFAGLSPMEEEAIIAQVRGRVTSDDGATIDEEETVVVRVSGDAGDKAPPGGAIEVVDFSEARFLIVADALAKSVGLARDERRVNAVIDLIEPFAKNLARAGRPPWKRRPMLKLIGEALLVQHRVSARVAVADKPDILWDRPDLERLYARLNDEYELDERAEALQHKLDVIVETARALSDLIDADRSTRLEAVIILLIAFEIAFSLFQVFVLGGR